MELAIAPDCPLSPASTPGKAPGVSIKETIGEFTKVSEYSLNGLS